MKTHPFTLPAGYFEILPTQIQAKIIRLSEHTFEVPAEYFKTLPAYIQQKIQPLQATEAGKVEDMMQVPTQYFENLQHNILRKINTQKQEKSISNTAFYYRWSMASIVVLLLVWGAVRTDWSKQATDKQIVTNLKPKKETEPLAHKETEIFQNIPQNKAPQTPFVQTIKTEKQPALPAQPKPEPLKTEKEDALSQYLAKADTHTEEAIATLASHEDMADDGSEDTDWLEAHAEEEILHEISEEEIKQFIHVLKKGSGF